jgi:AhpD family alkylhydroperoxidase
MQKRASGFDINFFRPVNSVRYRTEHAGYTLHSPRKEAGMSYIPDTAGFCYPWYMRVVFFLQRRRYGKELEPVRLWGRLPVAYLGMAAMYHELNGKTSMIDPGLRSLVQVLISRINSCEFCIDLNSFASLERGVKPEKLHALAAFEQSSLFSGHEKAALCYASAVTHSGRRIDAEIILNLRRHFDDQAIVQLAALIAYQNMSSKFNAALGIPAHGFCDIDIRENQST